jgi:hypothetical protein
MASAGALGKDEPPATRTPPEPKVGSSLPVWANAGGWKYRCTNDVQLAGYRTWENPRSGQLIGFRNAFDEIIRLHCRVSHNSKSR